MTVYEVWDWDPMASNWGEEYHAKTFFSVTDAEAEVIRRNELWRDRFVASAGEKRAVAEPWNWRHARMNECEVE